jgi:hypothetical protein
VQYSGTKASPLVSFSGNTFTSATPVYTYGALVEEFYDNTFNLLGRHFEHHDPGRNLDGRFRVAGGGNGVAVRDRRSLHRRLGNDAGHSSGVQVAANV